MSSSAPLRARQLTAFDDGDFGGAAAPAAGQRPAASGPLAPLSHLLASTALLPARIRNSSFSFAKTEVFYALSWADPALTASITLGVITLFFATLVLDLSLPVLVAQAAVLALLVSGAAHLHNAVMRPAGFGLRTPLAVPRLPLDRASTLQLARLAADALNEAISYFNHVLTWTSPVESAHALAYAWLLSRFAWLLSAGWLVLLLLLAVVAAPGYLVLQPRIDAVVAGTIAPRWKAVATALVTAEIHLAPLVASNLAVAAGAGLFFAAVFLYYSWSLLSLAGTCSLLATLVVGYDWVHAQVPHLVAKKGAAVAKAKAATTRAAAPAPVEAETAAVPAPVAAPAPALRQRRGGMEAPAPAPAPAPRPTLRPAPAAEEEDEEEEAAAPASRASSANSSNGSGWVVLPPAEAPAPAAREEEEPAAAEAEEEATSGFGSPAGKSGAAPLASPSGGADGEDSGLASPSATGGDGDELPAALASGVSVRRKAGRRPA